LELVPERMRSKFGKCFRFNRYVYLIQNPI
jgi:hypothetical protein